MKVFTFWEGPMPAYIKLCLDTWKFPFTLLTYKDIELPSKLQNFSICQIADYVRVHVLKDCGGYWLDADTIMLNDKLPKVTVLGNDETRENTIGFLSAYKQHDMFVEWAQYQDDMVDSEVAPYQWSSMGNDFTDKYLKEHKEVIIGEIRNCWPETYMVTQNISRYDKYNKFYFEQYYKLGSLLSTNMLMLHNSWTPQWYKNMTEDEVLNHKCTLSYILKEVLCSI